MSDPYKRPQEFGASCQHGRLARQCNECDLMEDRDTWVERCYEQTTRAESAEEERDQLAEQVRVLRSISILLNQCLEIRMNDQDCPDCKFDGKRYCWDEILKFRRTLIDTAPGEGEKP